MRFYFILILFILSNNISLSQQNIQRYSDIITGAQQTGLYLPMLSGKRVAIVTNASGVIGRQHLVDTLLKHKIKLVKIFGPEHGFRGTSDAGEKVKSGKDSKTGIPVVSLYGTHKKPTKEDLKGIDILIYDIQDVGVRFYTYISTMTYVMESCAENNVPLIILDRPNPNGYYIDGPVLIDKYKSFLGMHSVPIVYGMTCGEYAKMVNDEFWLKNKVKCDVTIITLKNYNRSCFISDLPVKPSPNLPNDTAVLLYPSLGLFEGTINSLGRGTEAPFQYIGNPYADKKSFDFIFTPKSNAISKKPKYQDTLCVGLNLQDSFYQVLNSKKINLNVLMKFYKYTPTKQEVFFDRNFNYHSGNDELKEQIISGQTEQVIRSSWEKSINDFKSIRKKYLLYPDFIN